MLKYIKIKEDVEVPQEIKSFFNIVGKAFPNHLYIPSEFIDFIEGKSNRQHYISIINTAKKWSVQERSLVYLNIQKHINNPKVNSDSLSNMNLLGRVIIDCYSFKYSNNPIIHISDDIETATNAPLPPQGKTNTRKLNNRQSKTP